MSVEKREGERKEIVALTQERECNKVCTACKKHTSISAGDFKFDEKSDT